MKNLLTQVIFAIAVFIALVLTGCGAGLNGPDTTINDKSDDKLNALKRLNVEREGIQQDKHYIYSTKCWKSAMESIAAEFSYDKTKNQLLEFCPETEEIWSDSIQQQTRIGIYTCTLISIPKDYLNCK
jgi:hypothetical protein